MDNYYRQKTKFVWFDNLDYDMIAIEKYGTYPNGFKLYNIPIPDPFTKLKFSVEQSSADLSYCMKNPDILLFKKGSLKCIGSWGNNFHAK